MDRCAPPGVDSPARAGQGLAGGWGPSVRSGQVGGAMEERRWFSECFYSASPRPSGVVVLSRRDLRPNPQVPGGARWAYPTWAPAPYCCRGPRSRCCGGPPPPAPRRPAPPLLGRGAGARSRRAVGAPGRDPDRRPPAPRAPSPAPAPRAGPRGRRRPGPPARRASR